MKIAVCEDEKNIAEKLAEYINDFMKSTYFEFSIDIFLTGEHFLRSSEYYDLLFLDCELPDINGLTLAKELRERDIETEIIFVTAYDAYVYDSFEVRPFRYLLKPIDENTISKVLASF
ncbi:MAG: LytTR family DNA-binding domain-containing protein, partial [Oscillospiraceae bacterium]|nr:LytTR family DNA-binding domain-containing protein [Oscillospiraceae bacterium]